MLISQLTCSPSIKSDSFH